MRFEMKKVAHWSFFQAPELEEAGILHGFCTGTSPSDLLREITRKAFLDAFSLNDLAIMNQEHGNHVHIVRNGQRPISGDGLIILEKNVAGIIKTADCLPIILCDPQYPSVSVIHTGWRGTVKGIVRKAVFAMEQLGSSKENILAVFGPSIGPCCYEVKEDVHVLFTKHRFPEHIFRKKSKSLFLDLKQANTWILQKIGINRIHDLDMCTYCNDALFHSFRRGDTGKRQINFVSLKG